jgi:hypothetical protein
VNEPASRSSLAAILSNAETAELLLKSSTPKLDELREIATDIRRDDQRASQVLLRLRSMLRKAPSEIRDIDLNVSRVPSALLASPRAPGCCSSGKRSVTNQDFSSAAARHEVEMQGPS